MELLGENGLEFIARKEAFSMATAAAFKGMALLLWSRRLKIKDREGKSSERIFVESLMAKIYNFGKKLSTLPGNGEAAAEKGNYFRKLLDKISIGPIYSFKNSLLASLENGEAAAEKGNYFRKLLEKIFAKSLMERNRNFKKSLLIPPGDGEVVAGKGNYRTYFGPNIIAMADEDTQTVVARWRPGRRFNRERLKAKTLDIFLGGKRIDELPVKNRNGNRPAGR
jgi:hypothetical protein